MTWRTWSALATSPERWDDLVRVGVGVAVLVGLTLVLVGLRAFLRRRLGKVAARTSTRMDDLVVDLIAATKVSFLIGLGLLAALPILPLSERSLHVIRRFILVISLFQAGIWGARALRELVDRRFAAAGEGVDPSRGPAGQMIGVVSRAVLWTVVLLMTLDNFGVNVTTLIAGLGVGGVAVALAAQNILGDFFASVAILLDKPFVVGDFIAVDNFMGAVEQIGVKTTRLRSLSGEQIVFANSDLIKSRLRNHKRMTDRRVAFTLAVVYGTPPELVAQIPGMLRGFVEAHAKTRFDRAHLASLGESALIFEVVYFVLDPDYLLFMDIQQAINLSILRQFAEKGIALAHPTRTVQLRGELPTTRPALDGRAAERAESVAAPKA